MAAVYCQAGIFLSTMALGYALKRLGILKPEDKQVLSNLVFYVTLPAMLIGSFGSGTVPFSPRFGASCPACSVPSPSMSIS